MLRIITLFILLSISTSEAVTMVYTSRAREEAEPQLAAMVAAGMDVVMNYQYSAYPNYTGWSTITPPYSPLEEVVAWMDACARAKIKVAISISNYAYNNPTHTPNYTDLDIVINRIKDHPALYMWFVYDEVTDATFSIATRQEFYAHVKNLTPDIPIYAVTNLWSDPNLTGYSPTNVQDYFAEDYYPYISWPESDPIGTFTSSIASMKSVVVSKGIGNVKLTSAIQISDDIGNGTSRIPDPGEITTMVNVAVAGGWADTMLGFYIWDHPSAYKADHPANQYAADNPYIQTEMKSASASYHENLWSWEANKNRLKEVLYDKIGNLLVTVDKAGKVLFPKDNGG